LLVVSTVLFVYLLIFLFANVCSLFLASVLCVFAECTGVPLSPLHPNDEDPLMAAVNLLELNWISIQEILKLTRRVLTQIFVRLWLKKRADMPADDLKKLAATFDTIEDPILSMKSRSVKRGTEGAIALAYSHGKEVDWEKVSSSHGRPLSELLCFFEKVKKYAPGIMSIITPSAASLTSTPASSTPTTSASMPPPSAGATSSAPSSATEPAAEVA
jgi:hypothetical protein